MTDVKALQGRVGERGAGVSERIWRYLWGSLAVMLATGAMAQEPATRFRLDNGLQVVIQPDHRAPVAVVQVWYRVGSADEPPGQTGLSHVLEHLMFKGTSRVPAGEFSRLVSHVGGDDNAFTTDNYTVYYQQHVVDRLPLALALEADRMTGLAFSDADFTSELQVVMEERRLRTDDNPQALALERFQALAHLSNPERTPTIGWMRDLRSLTAADARAWYRQWYSPANATLVVVGDVEPQALGEQIRSLFGGLAAQPLPRRAEVRELPSPGERQMTLRLPGQVPALFLGFNWPSLATAPDEALALRMLAGILDEGASARLEQRLVRGGQAAAINTGYDLLARGDTLFTLTAVPGRDQTLQSVREAILAEVYRLRDEQPGADEMRRVAASVAAEQLFSRDDISEQAQLLGRLASNGQPLDWADTYAERLRQVTPAQVQAVARKYLQPERLTTLYLEVQDAKSGGQP